MQCAGNRRADMLAVAPVSGDPWAPGAIGNAEWTGVRLAEVLRAAGIDADEERYVAFESHDRIADTDTRFGASIPLAKALAPETLLAFAMNGEPLAPSTAIRCAWWCRDLPASAARNGSPGSRCRTGPPTTRCRPTTTSCFRPT